ncbi:MAG: S8 family serine peptidase [Candidatus Eisenbacteria bacterium]|nr:S8 family serine peptidase [Candidatus Eisenbacteria bacterium]
MVSTVNKGTYVEASMRRSRALLRVAALALGVLLLSASAGAASPDGDARLWVFFTDKGISAGERGRAIAAFRSELPRRALERRAKVGAEVNVNDLPVAARYVEAVAATGATVETRSRWLNAVSVEADAAQAAAIAGLPFVREVRPVARGVKRLPEPVEAPWEPRTGERGRSLDYGGSFGQLDQIGIPALHDDGFDGSGVLICMLDTGFDTDHQAFRHLDIVGERDFINDDTETANEPGDPDGQDSHGTSTLSCVGAACPGEIYGGSYNASFLLGKTEMVDDEIEIEEDYWVEGVEWADSLGADIVSSSLGYYYWYTYEDMDGETAVTTIAADMAAARGIVVVTSMGNEGGGDWKYMIAPADGDSVLSVGAVDSLGSRVWFSSVGPTYDGRIKPDVMAQGLYVRVATTEDTASYTESHGTSFSCPLTASAVGLLLQGHPEWTPCDVIGTLRSTASQSASPDTLMGWGILDAYAAMYSVPLDVPEGGEQAAPRLVWARRNPFAPGDRIAYALPERAHVRVGVYDVSGRLVATLVDGERRAGSHEIAWDAADDDGRAVGSGIYFVSLSAGDVRSRAKLALIR